MKTRMESLLVDLLNLTVELERLGTQENTEPLHWTEKLDVREQIIGEIDKLLLQGEQISEFQTQEYVSKAYEINQRVMSLMESKHSDIQNKLVTIQRSKVALHTYHASGVSGYGAFFDKKK